MATPAKSRKTELGKAERNANDYLGHLICRAAIEIVGAWNHDLGHIHLIWKHIVMMDFVICMNMNTSRAKVFLKYYHILEHITHCTFVKEPQERSQQWCEINKYRSITFAGLSRLFKNFSSRNTDVIDVILTCPGVKNPYSPYRYKFNTHTHQP